MKRSCCLSGSRLLFVLALIGLHPLASLAQDPSTQDPASDVTSREAPSDEEILHIFITDNRGEVTVSEAVGSSASEAVRAFAQHMIEDHARVMQRADSLAGEVGMEPQINLVSTSLENAAQGTAEKLGSLSGAELDRTYMLSQIVMHQHALDMLDYTLIPSAQSEELRMLLENTRPDVANHLEEAQEIYRNLSETL